MSMSSQTPCRLTTHRNGPALQGEVQKPPVFPSQSLRLGPGIRMRRPIR
jgi:hypothetical protein